MNQTMMTTGLQMNASVCRRGAAMLLVMMAMMIASVLGMTFLATQSTAPRIAQNATHHASARLIAESGLTTAIEYVRNNPDWRTEQSEGMWLPAQSFAGGSFRVVFENEAGDLTTDPTEPVMITVVGTFEGVTHRVSARVKPGADAVLPMPGLLAEHFFSASHDPYPIANLTQLSDIDWTRAPDHVNSVEQINFLSTNGSLYAGGPIDYFGVRFTGYIEIPTTGNWTLFLESDDGSDLWINGQRVVDNDGLHGMQERSGQVTLEAGKHPIVVRLFERTGGVGLRMRWQGPGVSKQIVPAEALSYMPSTPGDNSQTPQTIVLYEFEEVPVIPQLIAHWRLDEVYSGGLLASNANIHLKNRAIVDGYHSSAGPYGPNNKNAHAVIATNHTGNNRIELDNNAELHGSAYVGVNGNPNSGIKLANQSVLTGETGALDGAIPVPTTISAPSGMPSNEGDHTVSGTRTFTSNRHFDELKLSNGATLNIEGNVTLLVQKKFLVDNNAQIILAPGATLTVYANMEVEFKNNSLVNADSSRPGDFRLYMMNDKKLLVDNNAIVAGRIQTVGEVELKNQSIVYGNILAKGKITLDQTAELHLDVDLPGAGGIAPPARDSSALGNDGVFKGGTTLGNNGAIPASGRAVHFNGTDGYVLIPHNDAYLLDAGSLSLWFRTEDRNKNQSVFSKDHNMLGTGGHLTVIIEGGAVKTRLQSTSETWPLTAAAPIQNNTWHHMVFTWGPNKMRLYLDGVEIGDPYNYIGGLGSTSGGAGNFEPIVIGADARISNVGVETPLRDFFQGMIDDVRIYDQAIDLNQVTNLRNGNEPGPSSFPGYIVRDTSGFGQPLDMTIQDTDSIAWTDGGGLVFTGPTMALSDTPASKVHAALLATGQFSVEAVFTPANITQNGPARIFSYSGSTTSRNFTVGQDSRAYGLRYRSTETAANGLPDINSGNVLTAGAKEHVVVAVDGYEVRLYRNGVLEHTQLRGGTLNWDSAFHLMVGAEADNTRHWLGELHRVAVYDRALVASQVNNLYNGLPPGDAAAPGGFAAVWVEQP